MLWWLSKRGWFTPPGQPNARVVCAYYYRDRRWLGDRGQWLSVCVDKEHWRPLP